MIQAAEYATDAVASQVVIEKTLTELSKVIDPAYQVVVNDLLALLHNLTLLSTPMREKILEIWNQLVSKDEIQPSIAPQIAGQMVLKAVFAAANEGVNPAVVLGGCTTIHLALTGFKLDSVVSPLISLLTSVHGTRVEATIVNNFIIPLLNDIFTGNVGPDQQEEVCSRLLDVQYLLQWDETQVELHRSLSNRPFSLNSAEIQRIRQERVNALFREARTNPSPARVLAASPVLAKELGGPAYQAFYEFLQVVLTQLQNRPVGEQGPIVGNIIIPLLQRIIPIVSGTEALDPAHGIRILSDLVFLVPSLGAWGVSTAPIDLEKLGCATADFSANTSALARIVVDRLKQVEKFISDEVGRRKLTGGPADEVVCQTGFLEWLGRILTFVQQGRLNVEILDRAHDVFCAEGGPLMREIIPAVKRAPKTTYSSTLQAAGIPDILSQW
jgi:hypothetical protein